MSKLRRWGYPAVALFAGLALWLLLAGPSRLLGVDTGRAGMALLVTAAWVSLLAVRSLPRGALERTASPGEWKAWIGVVFMAIAIAYFLANVEVFKGTTVPFDPAATAVGRNLVLLLVAWAVLSGVVASRWKGRVQEDERDREIERQAGGWGRGALIACVIGIAVTLAFSPPERLQWASHMMIANMLVFALMWGCLFEYAATAVAYWRDRH
jgi:uncharacterized membrane protein YidH (DUF202 family)